MSLSDDAECSDLVERRNRHYDISRINEIAVAIAGKIIGTRPYLPMKRFSRRSIYFISAISNFCNRTRVSAKRYEI